MSEHPNQNGTNPKSTPEGISKITISGFKSIAEQQSIEIRPLTILAGKNSSGKSSMMQPLLLLKQTLEAPYDPGTLLLNGPHVKFTDTNQFFTNDVLTVAKRFSITLEAFEGFILGIEFEKKSGKKLSVIQTLYKDRGTGIFTPGMSSKEILQQYLQAMNNELPDSAFHDLRLKQERFLLVPQVQFTNAATEAFFDTGMAEIIMITIGEMLHVPGLRGNAERSYPVTAVGERFPGTFDSYTASVILDWQTSEQTDKINTLLSGLRLLGLTNTVEAKLINDAQVEILVGRTLHGEVDDTVSIADVGIGVSQTLPVLVALLAAKPGQLVYIEQPEIHLHPRAQTELAQVLAEAAERGVRVVVETHSSLLLLGIQTLVAEGKLSPDLVKLHWFEQNKKGSTTIRSADLDEGGRFGDWPEDFGDVTLDAQDRFLTAAELHMAGF